MAVTFGFYNSKNGDRKYNAIQMSSIFDGIIRDGVLISIGNRFQVTATGDGMTITVGSGRAWFDHTWTYNDAELLLNVAQSDMILDRIDALVLEVDTRDEARTNSIRFVVGELSSVPVRPILTNVEYVKQYPLAYIYVTHGATTIHQANITNMIGTSETPFVTAPLETINTDALFAQWNNEWLLLMLAMAAQKTDQQTDWNTILVAMNQQKAEQAAIFEEKRLEYEAWYSTFQNNITINAPFDFDNLESLVDVTKKTTLRSDGAVVETILVTASGVTVADRVTSASDDGFTLAVTTLYEADGLTAAATVATTTSLDANGDIVERQISGFPSQGGSGSGALVW